MTVNRITNKQIYEQTGSDGRIYGELKDGDFLRFSDAAIFIDVGAESILDVGCFKGEWLNFAINTHKNIKYHLGIDVAQNKIDEGKRLYPNLNLKCGYAEALNLHKGGFDVVTCFEVLEHIHDWKKVFYSLFEYASKQVLITVPYMEQIIETPCIHCGKMTPLYGHLRSYSETDFPEVQGWNRSLAKLADKSNRPFLKKLYRFLRPHYSWLLVNYRRVEK